MREPRNGLSSRPPKISDPSRAGRPRRSSGRRRHPSRATSTPPLTHPPDRASQSARPHRFSVPDSANSWRPSEQRPPPGHDRTPRGRRT
ncbi:hypothetical protein DAI22_01g074700 [Oryza sativa Japonica Group]|nr:hypothetical protein DAI22_01g074700 [Oryza sativa Japonica Group]